MLAIIGIKAFEKNTIMLSMSHGCLLLSERKGVSELLLWHALFSYRTEKSVFLLVARDYSISKESDMLALMSPRFEERMKSTIKSLSADAGISSSTFLHASLMFSPL